MADIVGMKINIFMSLRFGKLARISNAVHVAANKVTIKFTHGQSEISRKNILQQIIIYVCVCFSLWLLC